MWVESEKSKGATFYVALPCLEEGQRSASL
jgi:hypothetical protein